MHTRARVLHLMLDGRWHDKRELQSAAGPNGDRRMRELRFREYGGFEIQCQLARRVHPQDRPRALRSRSDRAMCRKSVWRIAPESIVPERVLVSLGMLPPEPW